MKIYNSTEYFDREKETETYYELEVVNMWDWSTKSICFKKLDDGHLVSYTLRQGNPHKRMTPEDVTDDIREELINMGYTLK